MMYAGTVLLLSALMGAHAPASAAPSTSGPKIVGRTEVSAQWTNIFVESPAMGRVVQVQVLHPAGTSPRPSFYVLDGVDAPDTHSMWTSHTDIAGYFRDKNVNVVLPVGGHDSFFTDWQRPDPKLGTVKWETFLTAELPPLIDKHFHGTGKNAIGGISMGGIGAMMAAVRHPQLYRGVATFSSCYETSTPRGRLVISLSPVRSGTNSANMWGGPADPDWVSHDATVNAEALRGKAIYLFAGSGIADFGKLGTVSPAEKAAAAAIGGAVEAASNVCTRDFSARLQSLNIPATVELPDRGVHGWANWQDVMARSWPLLSAALN